MVDNFVVQTVEHIWKPKRRRQKRINTDMEEYLHATKGVTTIAFQGRDKPVFQRWAARKFADQLVFMLFMSIFAERSKSMHERRIKVLKFPVLGDNIWYNSFFAF
jgi:hypothetical protein